jgi:hypothetical protein
VSGRWTCATCGEEHVGLPLDFAFDEPGYWDGPRAPDDYLDTDLCVWTDDGGTRCHFVRGVLEIPVLGTDARFAYGVWGSLSAESFGRMLAVWDDARRVEEPPYFSWLSNSIPGYPETLSLRANVITRTPDLRPAIVLAGDADHPLAREQREGITVERAREIAGLLMHA